jgi:hypothetical protein
MTRACAHLWQMLAMAVMLVAGCRPVLETGYGRREDPGYATSINGTAVLGEMMRQRGYQVFSWQRLSPHLADRADAIVWFPDDTEPPSPEVQRWLERWLNAQPARTLVYVLRDFDAELQYWDAVRGDAPADQQRLIAAQRAHALRAQDWGRIAAPTRHAWFHTDDVRRARIVRELNGHSSWVTGIDVSKTHIEVNARLHVRPEAVPVLGSDAGVLVSRQILGRGQLVLVANGSFLLNLPLVNHEHRKLAGRLIDVLGPGVRSVAFLESKRGGPPIEKDEAESGPPSGLALFGIWPLNWILGHLVALGMLFAFSRWPIFGRARVPGPPPASDFGRHVAALAEHLRRTDDETYAQAQVERFRSAECLGRTRYPVRWGDA